MIIHVLEETEDFQENTQSQSELLEGNATAVSCGWFVEAGHGESGAKTKLFFHVRAPDSTTFVIK